VDKRADIWAFGVVLYEMLTGRVTFAGETVADTLAAVLKSDPDFSAIPADTPVPVRRLLRRCLERDRRRRLHDIADARLELDAEPEVVAVVSGVAPQRRPYVSWLPWAVAAAVLATAGLVLWRQRSAPEIGPLPVSFLLPPQDGLRFTVAGHSVSPDGRQLLVRAYPDGKTAAAAQLYLRDLKSPGFLALSGTEGAGRTAWSPDGRSMLFVQSGKLRRLDLAGGSPITICDSTQAGFSWGADGSVLLGSSQGPIQRVSAGGGIASPVLKLAGGEQGQMFPALLPGGRWLLYTSVATARQYVVVGDLRGEEPPRPLFAMDGGETQFAPDPSGDSGIILFRSGEGLAGVRFDVRRRAVTSEPFPVVEGLATTASGLLAASVSASGRALLYRDSAVPVNGPELVLLDRTGAKLALLSPGSQPTWGHLEFSPDDKRLLGDRIDPSTRTGDLWTLDLTRSIATRITTDPGTEGPGVWSPDGARVFFVGRTDAGRTGMFATAADGMGKTELLAEGTFHHMHVSPDGKQIVADSGQRTAENQIELLPTLQRGKSEPLIGGAFLKTWPQFSPDGRWLAYTSMESGEAQIYVQSHPPGRGKWQVSRDGGRMARWRRDGKELVFASAQGQFYSAEVREGGGTLHFGSPVLLFNSAVTRRPGLTYFAMTSDGQRFALHIEPAMAETEQERAPLIVMLDWMTELRR
jgi:Tol biopolymer transport system component